MKIITTLIPINLVTNYLLNQKQEPYFKKVGGLVTKIFLFFVYRESRSTAKSCRIQ